MREIKFRVWNKRLKELLKVDKIKFDKKDKIKSVHTGIGISGEVDEIELLQFTGLKDKNGKEIYEGDIIKHNELTGYCVIEWKKLCWCLKHIGWNSVGLRQYNSSEMKVIGNIHENPELLKNG